MVIGKELLTTATPQPDDIRARFEAIARRGEAILTEYGLDPDQIEVNTTPSGATWTLTLYVKNDEELHAICSSLRGDN